MSQHEFSIAHRRRLLVRGALMVLVGLVAIAACTRLENSTTGMDDGGNSSSGAQASSGSSSGGSAGGSGSGVGSGSGSGSGVVAGSGSGSATGPGDMVVTGDASIDAAKMACADTTYTDLWSPGYVIDPSAVSSTQSLVNGLTLPQKAALMRGQPSGCPMSKQYGDTFRTSGIAGTIQGYKFRDGPRGVCLIANSTVAVNLGNYSTTFPSGSARGAMFDMNLEQQIGAAMGDEMVASGQNMILAPVINILRHPAWGRSQETYGEDSFLLGRLGTAYVSGVQQYVPACVKHFAAYNIEKGRDTGNVAAMDEQTAYEIYGRHFEMVVQEGGVACVMAAYNLLKIGNGPAQYCTSNKALLTDMLRTTFGFQGFVLSDWWAMPGSSSCPDTAHEQQYAADAINAGLDMELPWNMNFTQLEADVSGGQLTAGQITASATRIATQQARFKIDKGTGLKAPSTSFNNGNHSITNNDPHVALAYQSAIESMVLLKNDKNTLPFAPGAGMTVAVVGASVPFTLQNTDVNAGTVHFATDVRTGDVGSSRTYPDPAKSTSPFAGVKAAAPSGVTVVSGPDATVTADFYVVVAGLTPEDESEGYTSTDGTGGDRTSFDLDDKLVHAKSMAAIQDPLIRAVAMKGKPMVVVLEGGSVINMPWLSSVPAVVMAWYPGQDGGHALGDLVFGKVNFSGKLPVTWPKAWTDEPAFNPGQSTTMDYYLGYRYFDKNGITPLFAFGYGLSYTKFAYANLQVPCATATKKSVLDVQADITNTGSVDGDEVALLFVSYPSTTQRRPGQGGDKVKELKGFHRATIKAGQTVRVHIPLRVQDLKYWDATTHSWQWETGPVQVMVGGSSDNLPLKDTFSVQ